WSDCSRLRENVGIRFSSLLVASAVARSPRDPCSRTMSQCRLGSLTLCHQPHTLSSALRSFPWWQAPADVIIGQVHGGCHFFSITHCRGCWCFRAKSITCVTFVS